jgi:peptidoglycan/xylan/chitin deacetylase (PgdA/CDA1 family)
MLAVQRLLHLLLLLLIAIAHGALAFGQKRVVALTFDDLPLADKRENSSAAERATYAKSVNRRILKVLRRHHAPAIGFVNEGKVVVAGADTQNRNILHSWITNGYDLGNHTYSHGDLSQLSTEEFEKDIVAGEVSIKPLMAERGKQLRYFRFPFSHSGDTAEKKQTIANFLQQRGYEVAACTIDTSDYIFEHAYQFMLASHDRKNLERLRAAYLEYTEREINYYSELNRQVFGRQISEVMVFHANRLNADTLDQVLNIFEKLGYHFVTLEQAQSDDAYRTPDDFVTRYGPMWGYRWARDLRIKVDGSREPEVPAWVAEYKGPQ